MNIFLLSVILLVFSTTPSGFCDNFAHIEQLFDIRNSISAHDESLPENIKKVRGEDVRTLERTFELNTSSLTTIEAYFRIAKIALSTGETSTHGAVDVLNEWLSFIRNQCGYDIEFLESALNKTRNKNVIKHLTIAKENMERLLNIANEGIHENQRMLKTK